mmetsp:Transcript_26293/g.36697  ORF Transcript_26293/g.36697 Transcript_26293/m.36697 type:complete len:288 (-) Transcript_26293:414-1277(-)
MVFAPEDKDHVAGLGAAQPRPRCEVGGLEELVNRRLELAALPVLPHLLALHPHHSAGANALVLRELLELFYLLFRVFGEAFANDPDDELRFIEHLEPFALGEVGEILELHVVSEVGLVDPVVAHGHAVRHAMKLAERVPHHRLEDAVDHRLEGVEDVLLSHERHLAVDLREFRLAVGSELLIAEALDDLEVAVDPSNHEDLLECLRGLGESIELAGVGSRWYYEVARSLRCRFHQYRRLNLNEAFACEIIPYNLCAFGTENEGVFDRIASDVEEAVLHANFFKAIGL